MKKTYNSINSSENNRFRFFYKKSTLIFFFILILFMISMSKVPVSKEDPIYKKCTSQTEHPGPWCYQEEVKKIGDPALCENIIKYWPKATGVRGQCYYELARKKMDCELCERIKDKDIKKMCELDVCK